MRLKFNNAFPKKYIKILNIIKKSIEYHPCFFFLQIFEKLRTGKKYSYYEN